MRTVQDLETAFADLADTAPHPDALAVPNADLVPVRPPALRRRVLAPAAAVLGTVAVIGGVVYATSGSDPDRQPTGSGGVTLPVITAPKADAAPDLTFRFTADAPAGDHSAASYGIDRVGQVLSFGPAEVTVHYVNPPTDPDEPNFDPDKITDRHPVQVNGQDGFYGTIPGLAGGERLYWEYAPGAWAEASASSRAAELALAESARPATAAVRVPVDPSATLDGQYLNTLAAEPSRDGGSFEVSTPGARNGGYNLTWGSGSAPVPEHVGAPHDVTINGRVWTISEGDQPHAFLKGAAVPISVDAYANSSVAELETVLEGLTIAPDLTDRSTWFDAADALP